MIKLNKKTNKTKSNVFPITTKKNRIFINEKKYLKKHPRHRKKMSKIPSLYINNYKKINKCPVKLKL